jgi:hypothetical protein
MLSKANWGRESTHNNLEQPVKNLSYETDLSRVSFMECFEVRGSKWNHGVEVPCTADIENCGGIPSVE